MKIQPNQAPLTMMSCWISGVGAHGIARRTTSPSHEDRKAFGGDSLVVLERPAEPFTAANVAKRENRREGLGLLGLQRSDEVLVFASLMWPLGVTMLKPRIRYAIEMFDTEEDEMVQTFATNRADESFDEGLVSVAETTSFRPVIA